MKKLVYEMLLPLVRDEDEQQDKLSTKTIDKFSRTNEFCSKSISNHNSSQFRVKKLKAAPTPVLDRVNLDLLDRKVEFDNNSVHSDKRGDNEFVSIGKLSTFIDFFNFVPLFAH